MKYPSVNFPISYKPFPGTQGPWTGPPTPWPGNWKEGERRIRAGSSQLFLFDQSEKLTQLDRLADLSATSMTATYIAEISKAMREQVDKDTLHGLRSQMDLMVKRSIESLSLMLDPPLLLSTPNSMSISTPSLEVISTSGAVLSRSSGTSQDPLWVPPSTLSLEKIRECISILDRQSAPHPYERSGNQSYHRYVIWQMHRLEETQSGLSAYWPPEQRTTQKSPLADLFRYET